MSKLIACYALLLLLLSVRSDAKCLCDLHGECTGECSARTRSYKREHVEEDVAAFNLDVGRQGRQKKNYLKFFAYDLITRLFVLLYLVTDL